MDLEAFGDRVRHVREEILKLTQTELAKEINSTQAIISRLELGIGGNIYIIFDFINYLNSKQLLGHMLFREVFDIELLHTKIAEAPKEQIWELAELLEKQSKEQTKNLVKLGSLLSPK
jgi:predicted transcriptional regulator